VLYESELKNVLGIPRNVRTFAVVPLVTPSVDSAWSTAPLSTTSCAGITGSSGQIERAGRRHNACTAAHTQDALDQ